MTIDNIRDFLTRYYEGQVTPAETEALKDFFRNTTGIPEDLATDAAIFRAIAQCGDTECDVPVVLKKRIMDATVASGRDRFNWRAIGGIAASVAVIVGLGFALTRPSGTSGNQVLTTGTAYTHEVVDSAEAVAVTGKMMAMLDRSLAKANRSAMYVDKAIAVVNNPLTVRFNN